MDNTLIDLLKGLKLDPALILVIVLGALLIPLLLRGLFALTNARHYRRKESIELWIRPDVTQNDLALEMLARHSYGVWLPATTIRRIETLPFPSRVFLGLGDMIQYIEPAGPSGTLKLKARAADPTKRTVDILFFVTIYVISAVAFLGIIGFAVPGVYKVPVILRVVFGLIFCATGVYSLDTSATLYKLPKFVARHPELFETVDTAPPTKVKRDHRTAPAKA